MGSLYRRWYGSGWEEDTDDIYSFRGFLGVNYNFWEKWALHLNWGEFGGVFRLSDDNQVSPRGLLAAKVNKVGLTVDYRPVKSLTVSLAVNEYFHKKFDIQDNNGNTIDIIDIHDSFGGLFSIRWSF